MRTTHILILYLFMCIFFGNPLNAQTCGPEAIVDSSGYETTFYLNFGNVSKAKSGTYKTTLSVGQTLVGFTETVQYNTAIRLLFPFLPATFSIESKRLHKGTCWIEFRSPGR